MENTKSSHIITTLKLLLDGKALSSIPNAKNFNQYPRTIKQHGIELVEVWKSNLLNGGRHKERSLHQTIDNIERAKKYLEVLQGIKPKKDEAQESRH